MAEFGTAYAKTRAREGRYSVDPHDPGGETVFGIARTRWPKWAGWALVDAAKSDPRFPAVLDTHVALRELAERFYRENFWDHVRGDDLPSQAVAEEVFDTGVNVHPSVAVRLLQRVLNLGNDGGRRWPDVVRDGWLGEATLAALRQCCRTPANERKLLVALNALQFAYYADLAEKDPRFERFLWGGWIERATYGA